MFTRIRLENFKSWRELDIELAPLTVLFGTNSSGKSSVLQSMLLLAQGVWMKDGIRPILGENNDSIVNLGSFRDIVHNHDLSKTIDFDIEALVGENSEFLSVSLRYKDDKISSSFLTGTPTKSGWSSNVIGKVTEIDYLGPVRQNPQRSYLWSGAAPRRIEKDGENTIAALVESTRQDGALLQQVAEWLVKMELVDGFNVTALDDGNRFYETLVTVGGVESALLDTGFGVSQVLPVVTMLFFAPEGSIILLEQPELHLHPRAQAHLADLLLHVAEERKLQLIIESHSEHLLRRLQRRIAEVAYDFAQPDNVRMYFCDKGENGSTIQSVEVDEYGQINNWPDNFFGDITGDLEAMTRAALQRAMHGG